MQQKCLKRSSHWDQNAELTVEFSLMQSNGTDIITAIDLDVTDVTSLQSNA